MKAGFGSRVSRAVEQAGTLGLDAIVIAPSPDLFYLTGYAPMQMERPTFLILRPGAAPAMLVPTLEMPLAAEALQDQGVQLTVWDDGQDPYAVAAAMLPGAGDIAAGDRMWASHLLGLQSSLPKVSFHAGSKLMGAIRSVKDADEIAALDAAGRAADETFIQLLETRFLGKTERRIAADIRELLIDNGHTRADFAIVASGPHSASPHHEASDREIQVGDVLLLDFGGELAGYYSDTSRTVVVAEQPAGLAEVYEAVKGAQESAFRAVRPEVAAQQIDRVARSIIAEAGFADHFIHRTGHGIGLEVHESPYLVEGNEQVLVEGMTFSIEPGIYLHGRFGVRIEDIVVVTADGGRRLNNSTRELLTVT